jgi:hypothetical protein
MKIQFELQPLADDDAYPNEATLCSNTAVEILQVLKAEVENSRNKGITPAFSFPDSSMTSIVVQAYRLKNNQE